MDSVKVTLGSRWMTVRETAHEMSKKVESRGDNIGT